VMQAHAEEKRAHGVNLDGGRAVEAHAEKERDTWREPRRRAHGWCGPRRCHAVETHMEEELGADVEAVSAASRQTRRRSVCRWVCGGEMTGLGFMGLGTLKKKNSSDGQG
jgi:hypothetical protein